MIDAQNIRDIADLKARLKAIEDDDLPGRMVKLERFMTGVMWAISTASAIGGFFAGWITDSVKKLMGH